ncbi:uncharacterized protein LOC126600449 [Malus sylvestris]|uniref:uncharacterized protein LOC126600449 n=1 Tax=Malus sylvestris TaxID=3752 RepID=UPI0021AD4D47|nr:uncharacterized protein LOC126600449 [Malus sylvestris]
MEFQRSSFSFRSSDNWVHLTLQGFQSPVDFKSQFVGELSFRQYQIFQKRFHAFILDEFPMGPDRCATLRFAPHQLLLFELRAHLRSISSSLNLDPAIYEALAPWIKSMARKLANPNGSMGFVMVVTVKILTIEYVDQLFDDMSNLMTLLSIGSSDGGSTSSSISLDFMVDKLGAERYFERGDGDLGSCSVCLEELSDGFLQCVFVVCVRNKDFN